MKQKWPILLLSLALLAPLPAAAQDGEQRPAPTAKKKRGDKSAPVLPLGNPGEWVRSNDYPARANREGREGETSFTLDVGADGVPTSCQVTISSGHEDLDSQTCQLTQARARFSPATDRKGVAIAGKYSNRVRWTLPNDQVVTNPFIEGSQRISFVVEADGRPTQCTISQRNPKARGPQTPCDVPGLQWEPFRDANGNAVAKRVWITTLVKIEALANGDLISVPSEPQQ